LEKFKEKADWIFVASQKKNWQENMKRIIEFAGNKKAKIAFNPSGFQIENDAKENRFHERIYCTNR
jgi:sugar phosphate isomerase/epimerase